MTGGGRGSSFRGSVSVVLVIPRERQRRTRHSEGALATGESLIALERFLTAFGMTEGLRAE